jgi:flagellin-like hook-associated protein FlgL
LRAASQLSQSGERLSTLRRINRGADDPAGLIAAQRLEAELTALEAASNNASRGVSLVHIADSALGSVSGLLDTIRGNVVEAAQSGLSEDTLGTNQIEIDAALDAINRIGSYSRRLIPSDTLTFVLSPDVNDTATLNVPRIDTATLGGETGHLSDLASGGSASLAQGDFAKTIEILDAAQEQVLQSRAEFGAFEKYTLESSQTVLGRMEENVSSALSEIRDTDVALESSRFVRAQILFSAATSTLAAMGQRRSMVLGLLGTMGNPDR